MVIIIVTAAISISKGKSKSKDSRTKTNASILGLQVYHARCDVVCGDEAFVLFLHTDGVHYTSVMYTTSLRKLST